MYKLLLALLSSAAAQTLETFDGSRTWSETNDPVMGVFPHADAGYEEAMDCANEQGVRLPMHPDALP